MELFLLNRNEIWLVLSKDTVEYGLLGDRNSAVSLSRLGPWTAPIITGPTARHTWKWSNIRLRRADVAERNYFIGESSKRGKRIRLFGNIAKSNVRSVAIKHRCNVESPYESKRSNRYSTRALAVVLRLARFRSV